MKKQLDTIAVINELKGASVFFPYKEEQKKTTSKFTDTSPTKELPRATNITSPSLPKPTSMSTNDPDNRVEVIRRSIKEPGKEVSYVRLSKTEKNRLAEIVYTYKRQGVKTTETEIGRIAINYLIEDYKANGKASILACLLAS